jgi:hypothetical protein
LSEEDKQGATGKQCNQRAKQKKLVRSASSLLSDCILLPRAY